MTVLRNLANGDIHVTAASVGDPGYPESDWEAVAAGAPPADDATRPYDLVGTAWMPVPPTVSLFEYLQLWTADEQVAAFSSASPDMIRARTLTLASPTINLGNAEVIAGIALAVSLGIVTAARAARIGAGLPPEAA